VSKRSVDHKGGGSSKVLGAEKRGVKGTSIVQTRQCSPSELTLKGGRKSNRLMMQGTPENRIGGEKNYPLVPKKGTGSATEKGENKSRFSRKKNPDGPPRGEPPETESEKRNSVWRLGGFAQGLTLQIRRAKKLAPQGLYQTLERNPTAISKK